MFKKDKDRTPPELATRARLNVIARLAGCGYLIYVISRMLKEMGDNTTFLIIAIAFMVAAAVVIVLTVLELIKGIKTGVYKEETYYTEEYLAKLEREQEEYRLAHPEEFRDEEPDDDEADDESDEEYEEADDESDDEPVEEADEEE